MYNHNSGRTPNNHYRLPVTYYGVRNQARDNRSLANQGYPCYGQTPEARARMEDVLQEYEQRLMDEDDYRRGRSSRPPTHPRNRQLQLSEDERLVLVNWFPNLALCLRILEHNFQEVLQRQQHIPTSRSQNVAAQEDQVPVPQSTPPNSTSTSTSQTSDSAADQQPFNASFQASAISGHHDDGEDDKEQDVASGPGSLESCFEED